LINIFGVVGETEPAIDSGQNLLIYTNAYIYQYKQYKGTDTIVASLHNVGQIPIVT